MRDVSPVTGARRDCEANFQDSEAYRRGREVLNGTRLSGPETLELVKQLRDELAYKMAREISAKAREREDVDARTKYQLLRVQVTCTYKDLELQADESLPLALETLKIAGYPPETTDPEMLALTGAIHKRWWEYDGQRRHLEDALRLYRKAYGADVTTDKGYQAINAAFILELMASLEAGSESAARQAWRDEAKEIRETLIAELPRRADAEKDWWYEATLAEALFGAGRYDDAVARLRAAIDHWKPPFWELESTTRQLAAIARWQQRDGKELLETSPAWQALRDALGETWAAGLRSSFLGKVGLALSGGGFRASLYHIGVLARLAELDLLRYVEVISCVSGGSIIGAHLYLELRHLLQMRADSQISRQDYVDLVARIERSFLEGVQANLRTRLLAEPLTAGRDALSPSFSQTERVGELFEEHLFSRVLDGEQTGRRWLNRLYIEPQPEPNKAPPVQPFNPRLQNWQRWAKVPILILNATTLNTGHSWQFTASNLGEPPGRSGIETNPLLNRLRYQDTPERYRCFPLGHAVAASAAVPGLFGPLVMEDLFQDLRLRLADGGVYDNQGIAGLLDQGCTVLLVSDASGQLPVAEDPGGGRFAVPVRANDVLMGRVRELQHRFLAGRRDASLLRGLVYVHLKQDLEAESIDAVGARQPSRTRGGRGALTTYGVRRDVQARLAELRTDLDAFTDFEAWSLMESGYRAVAQQIASCLPDVPVSQEPPAPWRFHAVAPLITGEDRPPADYDALCELLKVGQSVFFKLPALRPWMRRAGAFLGLLAALSVAAFAIWRWARVKEVLGVLAGAVVVGVAGLLVLSRLKGMFAAAPAPSSRRKTILQRIGAFGVGLATVVPAFLYLAFGNRLYLEDGQVPQGNLPPGARRLRRR
jgi:predicted acylesterase/phospholipase RssA